MEPVGENDVKRVSGGRCGYGIDKRDQFLAGKKKMSSEERCRISYE